MFIIEFQFLAGRYHATQWGRNVNEGVAEWPPSPYRLGRALVDVWKRRKPHWPQERIEPILNAITSPPVFFLPPATHAHTRSFLSSNERNPSKKQLIFDSFVALDREARVLAGFDSDLSSDLLRDIDTLLRELSFLGRSESWVHAGIVGELPKTEWNCVPVLSEEADNIGDTVRVACLLPQSVYDNSSPGVDLPSWMEGICLNTKELLLEGWSDPPALIWVDYSMSDATLGTPQEGSVIGSRAQFRSAKFALSSSVLPLVQDTVLFAEKARAYLMGIHRRIRDNNPLLVSPIFSGKDQEGRPLKGHKHAYCLPLDEDGDGRLDHLLVTASNPFDKYELTALDRLRSIWQAGGRPNIDLVLVSLSAEIPGDRCNRWISATPFVTGRHYRKGRGTYNEWLSGEIAKECSFHGLPTPIEIEWIPHTLNSNHQIRWMEFVRNRKNRVSLRGHGCILTFAEPVNGPFALGSECHFGLGVFVPKKKKEATRT